MGVTIERYPRIVTFNDTLSAKDIASLAADSTLRVVQPSGLIPVKLWDTLNAQFFAHRPDIELRTYTYYGQDADFSFLKCLSNLRRFAAEALKTAHGVEDIPGYIPTIESLSIGWYGMEDFRFLEALSPSHLRSLSLGPTFSKKPDLRIIERFPHLEKLNLGHHYKNMESIACLSHLQDLTLRSLSASSLEFLCGLQNLWSLDIKLGRTTHLSALTRLPSLKYLELWQVQGLADLSVIGDLAGLQYFFLQSLPNVTHLPNLSALTALRKIHLEGMKGLKDISAAATAPALEEFVHFSARGMEPSHYAPLLAKPSLQRIAVEFMSTRKDAAFKEMAHSAGVDHDWRSYFNFT